MTCPAKLTELETRLLHALQLYVRENEPEVMITRAKQAVAERKRKRGKK